MTVSVDPDSVLKIGGDEGGGKGYAVLIQSPASMATVAISAPS